MCGTDLTEPFHHQGGAVMVMQASLGAMQHLESCFHHCGGPVMVMQASSGATRHPESCFHHRGGPVKLVEACLWCDIAVLSTLIVL